MNDLSKEGIIVLDQKCLNQRKPSYLNKPVRKWAYAPFINPAHKYNLTLSHWIPQTKANDDIYPFAKLDKHVEIIDFDKNQYQQFNLSVYDWTYNETKLLMDICKRYELKFFIIQDRYNQYIKEQGIFNERTVEELKYRYHYVDRILKKNLKLIPDDQILPAYDLKHEIKRKQLLKQYYSRTVDEIAEENYLMNELKRIRNKQKDMEKIRVDTTELLRIADDILEQNRPKQEQDKVDKKKSIVGANTHNSKKHTNNNNNNEKLDNKSSNNTNSASLSTSNRKKILNTPTQKKKKTKNTTTTVTPVNNPKISASNSNISSSLPTNKSTGIGSRTRVVEAFKNSGVHVRGQKMIVTHNIGMKRIKMLEQVCIDLGLDTYPPPTEEIFSMLVELRTQILNLFDLKHAFGIALYDYQMLRHKNVNNNCNENESNMESFLGENESLTLQDNQKSFSAVLDSMVTTAAGYQRKRKASLNKSFQS